MKKLVAAAAACIAILPAAAHRADAAPTGVYQFTVQDNGGKNVNLGAYKGDVLLIVNTASLCGNTPQYANLENLYKKYSGQGLRILAFPENDFGSQEPGNNQQIRQFCTGKYNVTFDLFSKIDVIGPNQAPLYKYLTDKSTDPQFSGNIEWNFAKFLIDRDGKIVDRFPAGHNPESADVVSAIESALAQKA